MAMYRADLHIHTCLSPCGELEMVPPAIVAAAAACGLDLIGICDHNAAANGPPTMQAAGDSDHPVTVIPGMEITSREEVHVLGLFDFAEDALDMEEFVLSHLEGENDDERFGPQVLADDRGELIGLCRNLLVGATDLRLSEVVSAVHRRNGCVIAAHVDRERFGVIGQLGFVPPSLELDGLEHSPRVSTEAARAAVPNGDHWGWICGSDAHRLVEIGAGWTELDLEAPTAGQIRAALHRRGRGACEQAVWRS